MEGSLTGCLQQVVGYSRWYKAGWKGFKPYVHSRWSFIRGDLMQIWLYIKKFADTRINLNFNHIFFTFNKFIFLLFQSTTIDIGQRRENNWFTDRRSYTASTTHTYIKGMFCFSQLPCPTSDSYIETDRQVDFTGIHVLRQVQKNIMASEVYISLIIPPIIFMIVDIYG